MDKLGNIEIRVVGKSGNQDLSPDNYDIKHIAVLLKDVEFLLYPKNKKNRPIITYNIQEGSVRHLFKTTIQAVISFNAVLAKVQASGSIDFLELNTARAFENIQKLSLQKNYEFQIKTSINSNPVFRINPTTTFFRKESSWVDAEFYFYGTLKDAGGKNKATIHLDTTDYGYLAIETGEKFLKGRVENMLYKEFGVRTSGKQNVETGEIDTRSLKLLELIDYKPKFDSEYLTSLIKKAKKNWSNINPDEWLLNLRGEYGA